MKNNFIINLFGIGIRYWVCELPIEMYDEMHFIKEKNHVEWENLLFDFDFLKHFGFNHWSDLSTHSEQTGFLLIPENRIEIKYGAKFITRFKANDLNSAGTLFPLFNTHITNRLFKKNPTTKTFILIHYEKGLIAKYQFVSDHFNLSDLSFQLEKLADNLILKNIQHHQQKIKFIGDDSLSISSLVIEI